MGDIISITRTLHDGTIFKVERSLYEVFMRCRSDGITYTDVIEQWLAELDKKTDDYLKVREKVMPTVIPTPVPPTPIEPTANVTVEPSTVEPKVEDVQTAPEEKKPSLDEMVNSIFNSVLDELTKK